MTPHEKFEAFKRVISLRKPFWWAVTNHIPIYTTDKDELVIYKNAIVVPNKLLEDKEFGKQLLILEHIFISRGADRSERYSRGNEVKKSAYKLGAIIKAEDDFNYGYSERQLAARLAHARLNRSLSELSAEEIADLFYQHAQAFMAEVKGAIGNLRLENKRFEEAEEEQSLTTLNRGDDVFRRPGISDDTLERKVRDIVGRAATMSKMAGKEDSVGNRILKELIKPEAAPWWRIIRDLIDQDFKKVIQDWRRESRKIPDMPGTRWYGVGSVWCLVDVSGSISEKEYSRFCGVMWDFARRGITVNAVFWDTKPSEVKKIRSQSDLKRLDVEGYGGTIPDCLIPVLRKVRRGDWVVMLSDGQWLETGQKKFIEWANAHKRTILLTTDRTHTLPYVFKIGGGENGQ
jgi:hypothetical protein